MGRTLITKEELMNKINEQLKSHGRLRFTVPTLAPEANQIPNWRVDSHLIGGSNMLDVNELAILDGVLKQFSGYDVSDF